MASRRQRGEVYTPQQVKVYANDIRDALSKLADPRYGYREAHTYVRGDKRDQHVHDENRGLRVSGGDTSDPVVDQVTSQAANRKKLADASAEIKAAVVAIETAVSRVRDVFSSQDDYLEPLESYRP